MTEEGIGIVGVTEKKAKEPLVTRIMPVLLALAVVFSIINIFILQGRVSEVSEADRIMAEKLKPAELNIIKINVENCDFCYDIDKAVEELKKQNVDIKKEDSLSGNSQEGRELIAKYGIKKLPALLVDGELDRNEKLKNYFSEKGEIKENKLVYTLIEAPYYDNSMNKINGVVDVILIKDSSCEKCSELGFVIDALEQAGVYVSGEKSVEYTSEEGQKLIAKYEIKRIPAILISNEIDYYESIKEDLAKINARIRDNYYAIHAINPPYRDLSRGRVVGLVDLVYLADSVCPSCYDVNVNKDILERLGIVIKEEKTVDVASSEGKYLREKYQINKVPIILVSPEVKLYETFVQVWKNVGTEESDGWFVMRRPELLGTYKDLAEGKIVSSPKGSEQEG